MVQINSAAAVFPENAAYAAKRERKPPGRSRKRSRSAEERDFSYHYEKMAVQRHAPSA